MKRPDLSEYPELLTVDEAADWLRVSARTVRQLVGAGVIDAVQLPTRPGGRPITRIKRAALEEIAA